MEEICKTWSCEIRMVHEFLHQEITCKTILDYLGYGKLDLTLFDVIGELRKTMAREREEKDSK